MYGNFSQGQQEPQTWEYKDTNGHTSPSSSSNSDSSFDNLLSDFGEALNLHFRNQNENPMKEPISKRNHESIAYSSSAISDPQVPQLFAGLPPFQTANSRKSNYKKTSEAIAISMKRTQPAVVYNSTPGSLTDQQRLYHKKSRTIINATTVSTDDTPLIFYWGGQLKPRITSDPIFSQKVFLGGVPIYATALDIAEAFSCFGKIIIEWPLDNYGEQVNTCGYLHVVFESSALVHALLQSNWHNGVFEKRRAKLPLKTHMYVRISSGAAYQKVVQIIPWDVQNNYFSPTKQQTAHERYFEIFIGGIHGKMTAKDLYTVMSRLFRGVIFTCLEADAYGYPVGTGYVAFGNRNSYLQALKARYIIVKADKLERTLQLEPYLSQTEKCSSCKVAAGPYFCRNFDCLNYSCLDCFRSYHSKYKYNELYCHQPMFKSRSSLQNTIGHAIIGSIICDLRTLPCGSEIYSKNELGIGSEGESETLQKIS